LERSRRTYELVLAADATGLPVSKYISEFGRRRAVAQRVIAQALVQSRLDQAEAKLQAVLVLAAARTGCHSRSTAPWRVRVRLNQVCQDAAMGFHRSQCGQRCRGSCTSPMRR
jgi:hypothetical protein